jgi:chromosome transmission fidelity protein 8
MDIGLHLLEGNVVKLKLPFLVVEKKKNKRNINEISNDKSTESSLEILGVIRKKIIFKTRPKPTCNVQR